MKKELHFANTHWIAQIAPSEGRTAPQRPSLHSLLPKRVVTECFLKIAFIFFKITSAGNKRVTVDGFDCEISTI